MDLEDEAILDDEDDEYDILWWYSVVIEMIEVDKAVKDIKLVTRTMMSQQLSQFHHTRIKKPK